MEPLLPIDISLSLVLQSASPPSTNMMLVSSLKPPGSNFRRGRLDGFREYFTPAEMTPSRANTDIAIVGKDLGSQNLIKLRTGRDEKFYSRAL